MRKWMQPFLAGTAWQYRPLDGRPDYADVTLFRSLGWAAGELAGFHLTLVIDNYFVFFSALFLAATALVILLSVNSSTISPVRQGRYFALLLFACISMMLMVSAVDLVVIFLAVEAAAILILPSLVTNVSQMLAGPSLSVVLRRLWPMMLAVCVGTWAGLGLMTGATGRYGRSAGCAQCRWTRAIRP